jgi:hypothetical protein
VTDQESAIRDVLKEAGELHHAVWRIVDGDDPDWASWYADWLINLSELPKLLGKPPVRSELVFHLVRLGREYAEKKPSQPWDEYYARSLVAELGA